MHKGTTSQSAVVVVALFALLLSATMPAFATVAPSSLADQPPGLDGAKLAKGKVLNCDTPAERVPGATLTLWKEFVVSGPNNTTKIELRNPLARSANGNGEWDAFLEKWNYTYWASHQDWGQDLVLSKGRIENKSFDLAGDIAADDVCLWPKPLVKGEVKETGTGADLAAVVLVFHEDKGVLLPKLNGPKFSFRAEAGTYTITTRYKCHYDGSAQVTVAAGQSITTTVNAGTIEMEKIPDPCVTIQGQVYDSSTGNPIAGQANITAFDDESHFASNSSLAPTQAYQLHATKGKVKIVAKAAGYFDVEMWVDIPKGTLNKNVRITMTPIGTLAYEVSGWVKNSGGGGLAGARVDLYDDRGLGDAGKRYATFAIADTGGMYKFMVPNSTGNFSLIASKEGYLNNTPVQVMGGADRKMTNITLGDLPGSAKLIGTVYSRDAKGVPIFLAGARATLYDTMHLKSFTNVSSSLGAIQFNSLYAGRFFLVVDSPQTQANATLVTLSNAQTGVVDMITENHVRDDSNTSFGFAMNATKGSNLFNASNFKVYRNISLEHDNVSLRVGIDRSFGRGVYGYAINDWTIDAGEFSQWLAYRQHKWEGDATSEDYFNVNKTAYDRKAISPLTSQNHLGSVNTQKPMKFMLDMSFNTTKLKNGTMYDIATNTTYDTFSVNYTGIIQVPAHYERTATNSPFELRNYTRVFVDPPNGSGRAEVKFSITTSKIPHPTGKVWSWNDGTHTADNNSYVKQGTQGKVFLVSNGKKLIFSGEDSKDDIGDILKYRWNFSGLQNTSTDWISNKTQPHYYNETTDYFKADNNLTVFLQVLNRGLKANETNISVIVDFIAPVAVANITTTKDVHVNNGTNGTTWKRVWVNESVAAGFNASYSQDWTTSDDKSKDRNGTVRTYEWNWNDNRSNKKDPSNKAQGAIQSHAFAMNGTYNVTLNVTDSVGHWTLVNVTVSVNDTTKPLVSVEMWETVANGFPKDNNLTASKQGVENKTYEFRAGKNTNDPNFGRIVNWTWMVVNPSGKLVRTEKGDIPADAAQGKEAEKVTPLSSKFDATGVWLVSLNMSDGSKNFKNETFRVTIGQQPRPDLVFNALTGTSEKMNFSQTLSNIHAGTDLEVKFNLSNNKGVGGAANATDVVVKLLIDGSEVASNPIGRMDAPKDGKPTYREATVKWSIPLDKAGKRVLKLTAEASGENGGEHPSAKEDSKVEKEITVLESDFQKWGTWLGVTAAIIIVALLYYAWRYKKWFFSEEARTARKRRKEEEEEEEEEKEDKKKGGKKEKGKEDEDDEE